MNRKIWMDSLREQWYLGVAFVVCLIVVGYKVIVASPAESVPLEGNQKPGQTRVRAEEQKEYVVSYQEHVQQQARQIIETHRKQLETNPDAADAPAVLAAMGNLYRHKLQDYKEAATCYELLLEKYPGSSQQITAFLGLAACYENLGELQKCNELLWRMMRTYPPDSEEHAYAKAKIEGKVP